GFHGRVGQQWHVVVSLESLTALRERSAHISGTAHHLAWFVARLSQLVLIGAGVVSFVRAVIPGDIQFLAALKRRPRVIRNYRDAPEGLERRRRLERIDRNGLAHTCDL